jgi:DNA-binding XRE family transcriptional regulator
MEQRYVRMESRCSLNLLTSMRVIRINLYIEAYKFILEESYQEKLTCLGLDAKTIDISIQTMASSLSFKDFDGHYLIPSKFIKFCNLLKINPRLLYDDYYKFIFSNFNHVILRFRSFKNISQKQLAAILHMSPAEISAWENLKSYPNRNKFQRILNLFKEEQFVGCISI